MHKCGLCRHAVSVCLPVCPCVRVCHVRELRHNEQRHLRIFFTIEYPHHSSFSIPNEMGIIRRLRGTPLTGVSNAGGVGKKRDSGRIYGLTYSLQCYQPYESRTVKNKAVASTDDGERRAHRGVRRPLGHNPRFLLP